MKVKPKLLSLCPSCNSELTVSELKCAACGLTIRGEFVLPGFASLSGEDAEFAVVFIRNSGNLKDVQNELGLSYPTVRKILDRVIVALGGNSVRTIEENENDIMSKLKSGELSVRQALDELKKIKQGGK